MTAFFMTCLLMTAICGMAVDERVRALKIGGFGIGLASVDEPRAMKR